MSDGGSDAAEPPSGSPSLVAAPATVAPEASGSSSTPTSRSGLPSPSRGPSHRPPFDVLAPLRAVYLRVSSRPVLWTGLALLLVAGVYTAVLGWVLVQRYLAFQTWAWDLGIYNQAIYSTLFAHRLFYYTADLPAVPNGSFNPGSLLTVHFSPFLFTLIPFYALAPGPATILVFQTAALASGVLPVYLLGRLLKLPNPLAITAGGAYLLSPVLMGIGWYDFHAEALLPATVLWTIYFYYAKRPWAFGACLLISLTVIESIAPFLFLFAVGGLLAWGYGILRQSARVDSKEQLMLTFGAVVSVGWIGVVLLCSTLLFGATPGDLGQAYALDYATLGPNLTLFTAIPYALVHPVNAIVAASFEAPQKLAYVLVLLGSLAFLPLLGPKRLLLPAFAWIALAVLSNATGFYEFGIQFAAYPYPFLAAGSVFGLSRVWSWHLRDLEQQADRPASRSRLARRVWRQVRSPYTAVGGVAVALVVTSALISPLNAQPMWSDNALAHGIPSITPEDAALHAVIEMIPAQASVLTVSAIFPEVSSRVDAYVLPTSSHFRPGFTFLEALDGYLNSSEYVLLDFPVDYFDSAVLIRYANLSGFGILAEDAGAVLYERGWVGPPQLWVPVSTTYPGEDLIVAPISATELRDSAGGARTGSTGPPPLGGTLLWTGPYDYDLPPGNYSATFWYSFHTNSSGIQMLIEVNDNPVQVAMFPYDQTSSGQNYGFEFSNGNRNAVNSTEVDSPANQSYSVTTNTTLDFSWPYLGIWSVAGWEYNATLSWRLYSVTLHQLSP